MSRRTFARKIKDTQPDRARYQRNVEANRARARARKQRILIEQAIVSARAELSAMQVTA